MSDENPKIAWTKRIVRGIAGMGTGTIVASIIANNVEPDNKVQEVTVPVAGFVAGMAAKEYIGRYTDRKIDEAYAWFQETKKEFQELKAEKS